MVLEKVSQLVKLLLYPASCLYCVETPYLICESCLERIEFEWRVECPICRGASAESTPCIKCRDLTEIDSLEYIFEYKDAAKKLIRGLKYSRLLDNSNYIARIILRWLKEKGHEFKNSDVWTFAPSSKASIERRGFNQIEEILKGLNKLTKKCRYKNMFSKKENTKRQAVLSREERLTNIKGKIVLRKGFKLSPLTERIFIVDDVATTGSTLSETCRVLKAQYGKNIKIYCITFARPALTGPSPALL